YIEQTQSNGAAVARNLGIRKSKGDIVAFLDSDDEWTKDHLEKSLKFLKDNGLDGSFSWFNVIINQKQVISKKFKVFKNDVLPTDYVLSRVGDPRTSTFVMKKKKVKDILFDEDLKKHQDWDIFIRFANKYN